MHFIEKDSSTSVIIIQGLLKSWPITNPAKEVLFINEIEELIDTT
jgi:serine/threonine-protein phosphatase 2A regulatory subunit B'